MKQFSLGIIVAILLLVCCTGSTTKVVHLPQFKNIAESEWGVLRKYQDGENTVYLYERGSGGVSISVVTPCNH